MLQMWTQRTLLRKVFHKPKKRSGTTQNQRASGRSERKGTRRDFKRRKPSVKDGLRGKKPKLIKVTNIYTALNHTESLDNEADDIMIKRKLCNGENRITTNAMVDSGATADFIDQQFCIQHQIPVRKLEQAREVFVIDGKSSSVGPITQEAIIAMDIRSHREKIRFQLANLKKHEAILGMPWLKRHNPTINWDKEQLIFNSERYTEICLKNPPVVKAIPEEEAIRENLKTKVMDVI